MTPLPLVITPLVAPPLPGAAPPVPVVALDERISYYRELRDRKEEMATRHKEEMDPLAKEIAETSDAITRQLTEMGQNSARTSQGTATLVTNFSYSMRDPGAFRQWMQDNPVGANLLGNTVSKESLEEYLGAGNQLPPGINPSSVVSLRVNKPTKPK